MPPQLAYNAELHEYRLAGRVLPSVTQVLADLASREYRGVPQATMQRAALLGKAVHRMIELDCEDLLDIDSLHETLQPYLASWRAFRALSGFVPILSEQRVHSARYGYAGTLDLFGRLGDRLALIDAKRTCAVPRTAGPQTAAYEIALREHMPEITAGRPIDRYALHLQSDDRWQLVPFNDKNDARVFLSALTLNTWSLAA